MYLFGQRLKELRSRNNISQNKLAKEMNFTRATINAWEMGISTPNAHSLIMLSQHFKVTVDYLLGITDAQTVDISRLNAKEKEMVCNMVDYLSERNDKCLDLQGENK